MTMTIKGREDVPVGQYSVEFLETEHMSHPEYGDGLAWRFIIVGGKYDGQIVSRATGDTASKKNACGKMFKAVAGSDWSTESCDLEPCIGRQFLAIVEDAPSGNGTRVASIVTANEEQS